MHVMQKVQATVTCKITQQSRSSMSEKKQSDLDTRYYLRIALSDFSKRKRLSNCTVLTESQAGLAGNTQCLNHHTYLVVYIVLLM